MKAEEVFTSNQLNSTPLRSCTHTCTDSLFTHQIQQMHQQRGQRPRQQDRLLGKVQTHLGYCRQQQRERKKQADTPTRIWVHKQKMKQQMKWTGNKNERSASGKKLRIQQICSLVSAGLSQIVSSVDDLWVAA